MRILSTLRSLGVLIEIVFPALSHLFGLTICISTFFNEHLFHACTIVIHGKLILSFIPFSFLIVDLLLVVGVLSPEHEDGWDDVQHNHEDSIDRLDECGTAEQ